MLRGSCNKSIRFYFCCMKLYTDITELVRKHNFENYSLIASTDEYKLYYVYLNKITEGCIGFPALAIETKIGVRLCEGRENRLFVEKYLAECEEIDRMRKEKYGTM